MNETYYLYTLIDPRTMEDRYAGYSQDVERRYTQHLNPRRSDTTPKACWVRKLKESGLQPGIRVFASTSFQEALRLEKALIARLKTKLGRRCLNAHEGGRVSPMKDPAVVARVVATRKRIDRRVRISDSQKRSWKDPKTREKRLAGLARWRQKDTE